MWREKGWRRRGNKIAINRDLWAKLLDLCDKHDVHFEWIKGHAGHPENERCDQLALAAAQLPDLSVDAEYEHENHVIPDHAGSRLRVNEPSSKA